MTLNTLVRCDNPECKMPLANIQTTDRLQLEFSFVAICPFCGKLSGFKPESRQLTVAQAMDIHMQVFPSLNIAGNEDAAE